MDELSLYNITIILGILGFVLLIITVLIAMRVIKTPVKYHLHRRIGFVAFITSSVHAIVMLYYYLFS